MVPQGFAGRLRAAAQQHAAYLYSVDTVFCRLSNWGIIGNAGLYHAALFLGHAQWAAAAQLRLADEAALQIMPDGWHWEQSPMYHAEVMLSLFKVVQLAQTQGRQLPPALPHAAKKMCYAFAQSARPNHRQFLQSDSDDTDVRGLVTRGGVLFADAALKALGYPQADFDTWFTASPEACSAYAALVPAALPAAVAFAHSGNYYLRTGWAEEDTCVHFRCGCLGSGHGHADLLHLDVSTHGADVLVDSGRYSYRECPERLWLKSAQAHNTLLVDDTPFTQCTDTWGYGKKAMPLKGDFFCDGDWMLAEGAHLGYYHLQDPVLVQRTVVQLGRDLTFVLDLARAKAAHTYQRSFHFGTQGVLRPGERAACWRAPQCTAQLLFLPDETAAVCSTPYSPAYNRLAAKQTLVLKHTAEGLHVSPAALVVRPGEIAATLEETPVTSEKTGEPISRAQARAYTLTGNDAPPVTLLFALEECIHGVDLLRAGTLCGYGRVVVRQGTRQATLAW